MRRSGFLLILTAALTVNAVAQQRNLPDPAAGEVGGKSAVLLWPADGDVIGCSATLVPQTDPDAEIRYPCGEWFVPALGSYKVWIEGPSSISPAPTKLSYNSTVFKGRGLMSVFETTSVGEIGLRAPWPGTSLHLVNLESFASGPFLGPAFDRRASADKIGSVRMPTGRVIAGVFDRKSGDAVALARPVKVTAGGMTYVEPAQPAHGSDVLVVLDRPHVRAQSNAEVVALQLNVDGQQKAPTVVADSSDRVYAVWYGVEGRRAEAVASGRELTFAGQEFALTPHHVITIRGHLRPLPKLRVELAPGADLPADVHVQAKRLSGDTLIDVPLHGTAVDLGYMPAEDIDVVLLSPDIELRQRADLTKGVDETLEFHPQAVTIHGRLTRADNGVSGKITFTLKTRKPVTVETNDDGTYTARLWVAGLYRITASLRDTPPYQVGVRELFRDTELDVKLPRASVVVEIIDTKTRSAVAGANIIAATGYSETKTTGSGTQTAVTDDRGLAALPAIEPGTMRLFVKAKDYLSADRVLQVADSDDTQHVTVELTPVDEADRITVRLADGSPAGAAQLLLLDAATMTRSVWSGSTDSSGVAALPRVADTVLLIRHPGGGSVPVLVTDGLEWRLPAPAPPLAVRFVNATGLPARYAGVMLWVGGMRIFGVALNFLYGFPGITNADGVWRANNLPQAPLQIVAVTAQAAQSGAARALDPFVATIPYPWPEFPTVRAAE